MATTIETLGIDIELKPTGEALVDAAIKRREQQAKASNVAIERSAKAAADAQKRHEREIAAEARAAAAMGRAAKRGVAEESRKVEAAARAAGQAEVKAAREAAAAQKALAREVAATAREYQRQQAAAQAGFGGLTHARTARGPHSLAGKLGPDGPAGGGDGGMGVVGSRLAVGLGAALGAREIADQADAYTNANNKLRQLHKDTASLTIAQRELFNSAQEIGVAYAEHASLYSKVGKAALGMGRTQMQAIQLTETIAKAMKASGADGASAAAAMMQLGQALDSGMLRGEEFNSMAENSPILLELLAKQLGVTRAELRKMAEAGKLTSDILITSWEKSGRAVDEAYAKRMPTINEQFVRFNNELSKMFGELAAQTHVVDVLGVALGGVADQLRTIGEVAGIATKAVGLFADLANKIPGVKSAGGLGGVVKTGLKYGNPVGLGGRLIGKAIDSGGIGGLADDIGSAFYDDVELGGPGYDWNEYFFQRDVMSKHRTSERERKTRERASEVIRGVASRIPVPFDESGLPGFRYSYPEDEDDYDRDQKSTQRAGASAAKKRAEEMKQLREEYDRFGASLSTVEAAEIELSQTEDLLQRARRAGFATGEEVAEQMERKRKLLQDQLDPLGAVYRGMQAEAELLALGTKEREREAEYRKIVLDLQRQGVTLGEAETEQLRAALSAQEALREETEKRIALQEKERASIDTWTSSMDYAAREIAKFHEQEALARKEAAEAIDKQWAQGLKESLSSNLGDALRAVLDWKEGTVEALKEMARQFAIHVAMMTAQALALKAIRGAFGVGGVPGGSGFGGFLADLVSGGGMAHGGTYIAPGSGGGVDSRNVMFRVTPGERITFTPPGAMGPGGAGGGSAGGGGAPNVNLTTKVVNVFDAAGAALAALETAEGEQLVMNVIARNPGKLKRLLAG